MHPDIDRQQQQRIADQLRRLSGDFQQPYGWEEFQRRALEQSEALRQGRRWGLAAVAASLLIIVGGIAALSRGSRVPSLVDTRPNPIVDTRTPDVTAGTGVAALVGSATVPPRRNVPVTAATPEPEGRTSADSSSTTATDSRVTDSQVKSAEHW